MLRSLIPASANDTAAMKMYVNDLVGLASCLNWHPVNHGSDAIVKRDLVVHIEHACVIFACFLFKSPQRALMRLRLGRLAVLRRTLATALARGADAQ